MLFVDQIEPQERLWRGHLFVLSDCIFQLLARGVALFDNEILDGPLEFAQGLCTGKVVVGFGPSKFLAEQPVTEIQTRRPESRDHVDEIAHRVARDGVERMAPSVNPRHERHLLHHAVGQQSKVKQDDAPEETVRIDEGTDENALVPRRER